MRARRRFRILGEGDHPRPRVCGPEKSVFLLRDIVEPDTVSLELMKAGDIERNPGPRRNSRARPSDTAEGRDRDCRECRGCRKSIRANTTPVGCQECKRSFHKTCIGEPRYRADNIVKYNRRWTCKFCKNGLSEEETNSSDAYKDLPGFCMACGNKVTRIFLQCTECKGQLHKTKRECNGDMTRQQVENLDKMTWRCKGCRGIDANPRDPARPNENPEFKTKSTETLNKLKILQWNADSLLSKVEELRDYLEEEKIDVFMIQETKLIMTDPTPKFKGYTLVRQDRVQRVGCERNRGGGLITGIKEGIAFRQARLDIAGNEDEITEWITIEIPTVEKKKLRLTNIYIPPIRATTSESARCRKSIVTSDKWPISDSDCLFGDFNAHSEIWSDNVARGLIQQNARGDIIENWMSTVDMDCINTSGQVTRTNRDTTRSNVTDSSPDVSFVHSSMLDKFQWQVQNHLGSDHKPIIILYEDSFSIPKIAAKPRYKWRLREAKWEEYTRQVDSEAAEVSGQDPEALENQLRDIVLKAAGKFVGTKKITENVKPWLTKKIRGLIKERNELRANISVNRLKFKEKSMEIRDSVREEKGRLWKEYVQDLDMSTNPTKVWQTIRTLDGRYKQPRKNEALVVNNVALIEDADKAEAFAKTYREFSKLPVRKEDRKLKRKVRQRTKKSYMPSCEQECEAPITIQELNRVIDEAGTNKAAGDDNIPYEFIKYLGPVARELIVKIYNLIWVDEFQHPRMWRTATILPNLKDGKDPAKTASYRPISLTSCLGKLMEKIVADRMTYLLETQGLLTKNQAGFRPGRCTTDQILKLTQNATDQMQRRDLPKGESHASLVTFFDYEKAYDKVWRHGLLYKMQELGLPRKFIRFTRSFLSGRVTTVKVNETRSRRFLLKEGLPQGSSISPLLFLVFINDIDVELSDDTLASLFADDTSVCRLGGVLKDTARDLMQDEVDTILRWAQTWKMSVNTDKTQSMVISSNTNDTSYNPELQAGNGIIANTERYRFLGVSIDNSLRFTEHVKTLLTKCKQRVKIVKTMAWKDWGSGLETQRTLYIQYIRMCLEYASSSWAPWLAPTNLEKLEILQREALRSMAGLTKDCPKDFIYLETDIERLEHRFEKNDEILWDKFLRLPESDDRFKLVSKPVERPRLRTREGFRHQTIGRIDKNITRAPATPPLPPWLTHDNLSVHVVPLEKKKSEYEAEELLRLSLETIESFQADFNIYTDGSTDGQQENGGAGVHIETGDGEVIERISVPAGRYCASYGGEIVAMLEAMKWIEQMEKSLPDNQLQHNILICTDSRSLTDALDNASWKDTNYWMKETRKTLTRISSQISLLWIPSHVDIPGNEEADELAKAGSAMCQSGIPVTRNIIKARVKRRPWEVKHERALATFGNRRKPKFEIEKEWPKRVRVLFTRLRSGHAMELKGYRHFIGIEEDDLCNSCGVPETIEHVLCHCWSTQAARQKLWEGTVTIDMLTSHPDTCRQILSSVYAELNVKEETETTLGSGSNRVGWGRTSYDG